MTTIFGRTDESRIFDPDDPGHVFTWLVSEAYDDRGNAVHYRYRAYTQKELCAFYRAADVALVTPLRDGMNLVTQEYVAASDDGVLVLSELTGAAYLMPEALQVNPYDPEGLAAALKESVEMSPDERSERLERLRATVRALDVHRWAAGFLDAFSTAGVRA